MTKINSNNLESAEYDAANQCLEIRFKNGNAYRYQPVSAELFAQFAETFDGKDGKSAGKFFYANIRSIPCEQIEDE